MSGVVPTDPEQPAGEMEKQIISPTAVPDAPPDYNSHFVPVSTFSWKVSVVAHRVPPRWVRRLMSVNGCPGSLYNTSWQCENQPSGKKLRLHFQLDFCPAGPAAPPPTSLPTGYNIPQHPGAISLYYPIGSTNPIQYQPGRYPMTNQPAPVMWMPGPTPMPNCPPGLEYLAQLDSIHVLQHFEPLEVMTGFETNNRYDIKNNIDQMVYIVTEDTDDYTRNAYRNLRPFVLRVTDCLGREIMTMQRPFRCTCCCFCCSCARQELEVQCPPGATVGFVAEHWNLCRATYSIQNQERESMMRVRGPCATYGCGSDSVFEVSSLDGASDIGSIIRKWNGFLSTMGNADHFEIRFPLDLDVKMKAMIFGACFLIDFMYFERTPSRRSSV